MSLDTANNALIPRDTQDVQSLILGKAFRKGQFFYGLVSGDGTASGETVYQKAGATAYAIKNGGQRQPMPKTTRNPQLEPPSVMAMRYLGQYPNFKVAMDMVFHKKVGIFPAPEQGAGLSAFNFTSLPAFGGTMQLTDAVAHMLVGAPINSAGAYNASAPTTTPIQLQGTVQISNNQVVLTGNNTNFASLSLGNMLLIGSDTKTVVYIANNTSLTVDTGASADYNGTYSLLQISNIDPNSQYSNISTSINSVTSQVALITGGLASSMIQLSDPSHAIPFMQAYSSAMGAVTSNGPLTSLFSNDIFASGYGVAKDLTNHLSSLAGGSAAFGGILDKIGSSSFSVGNISSIASSLSSGSLPFSNITQALGNAPNILGQTPLGAITAKLGQFSGLAQQQGAQILAHIVKKNGNF